MNYKQTVKYLYSVVPSFQKVGTAGYKEGLSNTLALDEHFGHPHRSFKTIHVAGTNGKGSCSHTLAAMLQATGLKVDIAVVEVGLGGRLDCTNVITPEVSVITNISFDHTQFLGNTMAEIAGEKAGIIKHGVPVVIGETTPETKPVFEQIAAERHAPIHFAEKALCDAETSSAVKRLLPHFELKGNYQENNLHTILTTARLLNIPEKAILKGLENVCEMTGLMGRWQTLQKHPLVICDTGHNVGGWQYVSKQIAAQPCKQLRLVFGMVDDKDIDTVMGMLPQDAVYYWTQASTKRAIPSEKVQEKGKTHGLSGNVFYNVKDAYEAALKDSDKADFVFVGGSSYIVSDLLEYLNF